MNENYQVFITKEAEQDLEEIFDFIFKKSQDINIAQTFTSDLINHIRQTLSYMPQKCQTYKKNIKRQVYRNNTNYSFFFSIDEQSRASYVLAITHTSQFTRYAPL